MRLASSDAHSSGSRSPLSRNGWRYPTPSSPSQLLRITAEWIGVGSSDSVRSADARPVATTGLRRWVHVHRSRICVWAAVFMFVIFVVFGATALVAYPLVWDDDKTGEFTGSYALGLLAMSGSTATDRTVSELADAVADSDQAGCVDDEETGERGRAEDGDETGPRGSVTSPSMAAATSHPSPQAKVARSNRAHERSSCSARRVSADSSVPL